MRKHFQVHQALKQILLDAESREFALLTLVESEGEPCPNIDRSNGSLRIRITGAYGESGIYWRRYTINTSDSEIQLEWMYSGDDTGWPLDLKGSVSEA